MSDKPKRRWFQFSLRTLILVVTATGTVLGVGMAYVGPAEQQRGIVQRVEGLGGRVVYYEPPQNEWWGISQLRLRLSRDYFDRIEVVDLHGRPATDAEVRRLKMLSHLRLLFLDDTQTTDAGLVHLHDLKQLHCIWLRRSGVTYQGLADLRVALPTCEIIDKPSWLGHEIKNP